MSSARSLNLRGDLALLACAVGWGLTFPLIRDAVQDNVSPLLFVGVRFALATAVLLPLAAWRGVLRPGWGGWRDGLLVGALLFVGFATQTLGLRTLPAARSAFLTSFYVLFTPLLAVALTRTRPTRPVLAGLALAFAGGAVFTSGGGLLSGGGVESGDVLTLVCALAFAGQMVALSAVVRRHGALRLTLMQNGLTAAAALALAPWAETLVWRPDAATLLSLLFTGLVGSALLLGLQAWGQKTTSAPRAAVLFASEPVWAALFAWLLWSEAMGAREMAGAALILAGILVAELLPARPAGRRF